MLRHGYGSGEERRSRTDSRRLRRIGCLGEARIGAGDGQPGAVAVSVYTLYRGGTYVP